MDERLPSPIQRPKLYVELKFGSGHNKPKLKVCTSYSKTNLDWTPKLVSCGDLVKTKEQTS